MSDSNGEHEPNQKRLERDRQKLANRERASKAMKLRIAGASYQAIAGAAGFNSRPAAHAAVQRAIKEVTREPAEQLRTLHRERLQSVLLAWWQRGTSGQNGAAAEPKAAMVLLRTLQQLAALDGLEVPRLELEHHGVTLELVEEIIAAPARPDPLTNGETNH